MNEVDERPGLQPERTLLAWTRTLLTTVVVAALLVRAFGPPVGRPVHLPAVVAALVVLWLFVATDRRYRDAGRRERVVPGRHLLAIAGTAVLLGAASVVALLAR